MSALLQPFLAIHQRTHFAFAFSIFLTSQIIVQEMFISILFSVTAFSSPLQLHVLFFLLSFFYSVRLGVLDTTGHKDLCVRYDGTDSHFFLYSPHASDIGIFLIISKKNINIITVCTTQPMKYAFYRALV